MSYAPRDDSHAQDLKLVRAALRGDHRATRELVDRLTCIARILHAVNESVVHPLAYADIEDVSQSTALVLWKKLSSYEGRAKLESWVYRIGYLEFMNVYRKRRRERTVSSVDDPSEEALHAPGCPDAMEVEEVERAIDTLAPPIPEIIRMKHHQGLTFREIGESLDLSPNSAKTYYYRGIEGLRTRFALEPERAPR